MLDIVGTIIIIVMRVCGDVGYKICFFFPTLISNERALNEIVL